MEYGWKTNIAGSQRRGRASAGRHCQGLMLAPMAGKKSASSRFFISETSSCGIMFLLAIFLMESRVCESWVIAARGSRKCLQPLFLSLFFLSNRFMWALRTSSTNSTPDTPVLVSAHIGNLLRCTSNRETVLLFKLFLLAFRPVIIRCLLRGMRFAIRAL